MRYHATKNGTIKTAKLRVGPNALRLRDRITKWLKRVLDQAHESHLITDYKLKEAWEYAKTLDIPEMANYTRVISAVEHKVRFRISIIEEAVGFFATDPKTWGNKVDHAFDLYENAVNNEDILMKARRCYLVQPRCAVCQGILALSSSDERPFKKL